MKNKILIILLIGSFFFLRLYKIEERLNFSMDQGMFLLKSWNIFQNKELVLIGPTASPIVNGHQFFQGPLIYYSLIGLMMVSGWKVLVSSYVLVFLNFVGLIFLYLATKNIFNRKIAILTAIIYTFLPVSIDYSNFLWNPNFLLILTPIFIFLGNKAFENKKIWFLIFGFWGGVCLQFHFQFLLILLFSLLFLIIKKRKLKEILGFIIGSGIGYLPLIIFDLRNNFYNIKTMWQWVNVGGDSNFSFQIYYFLAFVPFLAIGLAFVLNKFKTYLIYLLILGLIEYSYYFVFSKKEALGMSNGWNYVNEKMVVNKILENGCPKNFNVAETISGDTRAYDIRFLLTEKGCLPMGVEDYPKAQKLFLIAPKNRPAEKETVWEVSSLGKFEVKNKMEINQDVIFYELEGVED